jgi:hypothetical protein
VDIIFRKILGWQRNATGCTLFLEVEIAGTIQGTCRLTLPADADLETVQRVLGDALADTRRGRTPDRRPEEKPQP